VQPVLLGLIIMNKLRTHNLNASAQTPGTSWHTLKLLNHSLPLCWLKQLVEMAVVTKIPNINDGLQSAMPVLQLLSLPLLPARRDEPMDSPSDDKAYYKPSKPRRL
jgi:hypothetical protein